MEEIAQQIKSGHVAGASITVMAIVAVLSLLIPICGCIYLKKKYDCKLKAFLAGAMVWLVFASIFESVVNSFILSTEAGSVIESSIWLYALYAGFIAALFEETGRYYGLRYIMKTTRDNDMNACMYGLGHGGFEAIYIVGLAMVSNITCAVMINNGSIGTTVDTMVSAGDSALSSLQGLLQLITEPSGYFFLAIVERIAAMAAHMAMSVPVWFAVKENRFAFYFVSFFMHLLLDFVTVIAGGFIENSILCEAVIYAVAAVLVFISFKFFKSHSQVKSEETNIIR